MMRVYGAGVTPFAAGREKKMYWISRRRSHRRRWGTILVGDRLLNMISK